jgi:predicted cupin superfamily sugar epimerase
MYHHREGTFCKKTLQFFSEEEAAGTETCRNHEKHNEIYT